MPQDACLFFYNCKGCGQRLKPKAGDCCVFCSYGSVPCPPVQAGQCGGRPENAIGRLADYEPHEVHKDTRRNRREFPTTLTDVSAIAAAAMIGESRMPKNG